VRHDPADMLMVEDDPSDALIAAVGRLARCGAVRYMCGYDLHAGVCRHLQCHCWRRWSGGGGSGIRLVYWRRASIRNCDKVGATHLPLPALFHRLPRRGPDHRALHRGRRTHPHGAGGQSTQIRVTSHHARHRAEVCGYDSVMTCRRGVWLHWQISR